MLISVVKNKEWEFSKMGIDMTAAFDTIKRKTILNLLIETNCGEDDVRLVRYLISNTKLQVRVGDALSTEFESSLGAFQGDSLSGKLFTLVLAGALNDIRRRLQKPTPPISTAGIPQEWVYAENVDFEDEDLDSYV